MFVIAKLRRHGVIFKKFANSNIGTRVIYYLLLE